MKVEVRLFAYFRDGREKKSILDLAEGTTPRKVLDAIKIDLDEVSIFLVNGIDILVNEEDGKLDNPLKDNDVIALFPPVGGG